MYVGRPHARENLYNEEVIDNLQEEEVKEKIRENLLNLMFFVF